MTGPVQAKVGAGASGNLFTYSYKDVALSSPTRPENWSALPKDNVYRKEWDAFARDLSTVLKRPINGQSKRDRPLILDAIDRHIAKIMAADARGVEPSKSAKMEAVREAVSAQRAIEQARPKTFAPKTSAALAGLTAPNGALTGLAKSGLGTLTTDPSLLQSPWGASLQASLTNVEVRANFALGVAEGVLSGGKDMIVGLATVAGKVAQFTTDATIGLVGDAIRSALPSGAQAWMRESAAIPSYSRAVATTNKAISTLGAVKDYIATRTPEQVGADIKGFVEKNWNSLQASHAEAAAKGPEAEARWWGQVTGRAVFEVASVFVPVTKVATVLKAADKMRDLAKALEGPKDTGKAIKDIDNFHLRDPDADFAGRGYIYSTEVLRASEKSGLSPKLIEEVKLVKQGTRPAPSTYMTPQAIEAHLDVFRSEGAIRITTSTDIATYQKIGQADGGFVIAKSELDDLIAQTGGDKVLIEKALGLEAGRLSNGNTVIAWIKPEHLDSLRMPSGNENSANSSWIPGGFTSGGNREAVLNMPESLQYEQFVLGAK
jgi:hypothetical protein